MGDTVDPLQMLGGPQDFAVLEGLTSYSMDFHECAQLASVTAVGRVLANLKRLTSLKFNFEWCESLTSVTDVTTAVGDLKMLTSLTLLFAYCTSCHNLGAVGPMLWS